MTQLLYRLIIIGLILTVKQTAYSQDFNISFSLIGSFNDENNDGLAQVGETILFTCAITNTGTETIDSIIVTDSNEFGSTNPIFIFNGKGPIYNLQVNQIDNSTYSCLYTLNIQDILDGSVSHHAVAKVYHPDPDFMFPTSFLVHESVIINYNSQPTTASAPMIEAEEGDIYIHESENGVILKSPGGNCFRIRVEDDGRLRSVPVNCP